MKHIWPDKEAKKNKKQKGNKHVSGQSEYILALLKRKENNNKKGGDMMEDGECGHSYADVFGRNGGSALAKTRRRRPNGDKGRGDADGLHVGPGHPRFL